MRYIALLRGINVGGNTMVKMESLRQLFAELGFTNVVSYINSGNLAFETGKTDDTKLATKIGNAIEVAFGLKISVMVRQQAEISQIIDGNPYEGQFENDKDLHVFFLQSELSEESTKLLLAKNSDAELITVNDRNVYYLLRISIIDSVLGKGFIDRKLKVPATARNWRTVKKLPEM